MAAVVQNEHDGIEPVTHRRGQLHPRHLERAEHDRAIAGFNVLPHIIAAHRALVNAEIKRVMLADDRFAEQRGGDGELPEHLLLRVELAHLVVQQRVFLALLHARRAADDDDGRFVGKRFCRGVRDFQTADAVRNADRAEPFHARVGVGGEASALLVAGV